MPNTLLSITGPSTTTYNFQQEVAEPHRLVMKEETLSTDTHRFHLSQSRSYPVVNGDSRGTRKTRSKITRDMDVPNTAGDGNNTDPAIFNGDVSLPVGRTTAQADEFVDAIIAYVSSAAFRLFITEGTMCDA